MLTLRNDQWNSKETRIPNLVRSVDAVVDGTGEHVYLREARSNPAKIYHYQVSTGKWLQPIQTYTIRWSMLYIAYYNKPILVGGFEKDKSQCTSDLIGVGSNVDGTLKAEKILSDTCLPTKRCRTTALVYTDPKRGDRYIIILGGEDEKGTFLTTVHIFEDTTTQRWCQAKDIPEALSCSSGAIANGHLYLLGGWYNRDRATSSVYRCNVDALIQTRQILMPLVFQQPKPIVEDIWEKLPDLPVQEATCTSFRDDLIVVGGVANQIAVSDIRCYIEQYKRWEVIGYLPYPRYRCFAVGLSNKLIVIGGLKSNAESEDTIEIYTR